MLESGRMSQVLDQEVAFMSCLSQAGWVKFLTMKLYSCHAWVRQDEESSSPGRWIHVMLQSDRMSQVHNQEVVFMQCSSQAGWVKFMNKKLYSCHAGITQDESSSWSGSCIHVMLQSGRMGQGHDQEVVLMLCLSQEGRVKFLTRKLYSCHAPVRQDESSSWPGSCIHVIPESGRMNQVLEQEVVFMLCSGRAEWVKFIHRKLYLCHAPVWQDESNSWPGSCMYAMLQSGRMSQVHTLEVVFISCSSQAGWVKFMTRKLYSCHAPVRQDESSSLQRNCIHAMLQSGRTSQVHDQEVVFMSFLSQVGWIKFLNRKLYSCHAPVGQNESSSYTESCIYVMLQSGRMNQVLDQVIVFMQCSSQAGWIKFLTR
jgi:hypothetical protein